MNKLSSLLEAVELFEKLATGDITSLVSGHKAAITGEIAGGIRACNKLMTTNTSAAASEGMQALDECFGLLGSKASQLSADNLGVAREMHDLIRRANFFTSTGNAGTGYDPITQTGGAWSPAAYLNRITTHVNALMALVKSQTPAPAAPTNIA